MKFSVLLVAVLLQAPSQEPRGLVAGRFISAQTGEPLKSVTVQLGAVNHGQSSVQTILTGVDGTFSFGRLPAAPYFLHAEKSGYQLASALPNIALETNQSVTGIEIKMNRAAVITGAVTDA